MVSSDNYFCQNKPGPDEPWYPVLSWYGGVLGSAACASNLECLHKREFLTAVDLELEMYWTTLGCNLVRVVNSGLLEPRFCVPHESSIVDKFESFGSEVMGEFAVELTKIEATLESQQLLVEDRGQRAKEEVGGEPLWHIQICWRHRCFAAACRVAPHAPV